MIKINAVQPDKLPFSFHIFQPKFVANFIDPVTDQCGKKENITAGIQMVFLSVHIFVCIQTI